MHKYQHITNKILPIYWAFLTYMLLRPGTENKEFPFMFPGLDKLVHFSIFAALGLLLKLSFPRLRFSTYFYIGTIYGTVTEILQDAMAVGRTGELLDIVADCYGLLAAWFIITKIITKYR